MDGMRMVPLVTTRSSFEARVLAARLGAEGIVWQLRGGSVDSVYPVGDVDVLVAADDLDRARELLSADEPPAASSEDDASSRTTEWWLAVAVLAAVALFIVLRMFSL
jgi:MYXO-CTERM domain-containing protein